MLILWETMRAWRVATTPGSSAMSPPSWLTSTAPATMPGRP